MYVCMYPRLFNFVVSTSDYGPHDGSTAPPVPTIISGRYGVGTWNVSGCASDSQLSY